MSLRLINAPAELPLTPEEAMAHLKCEADELPYVQMCMAAATAELDGFADGKLGRCLVTQTWELVLDGFPCDYIQLPATPIQSVTSIKYDDANGVEQTWAASNYQKDLLGPMGRIVLASGAYWPTTKCAIQTVRVRFVAGFGAATAVPADIKIMLCHRIAFLLANRGDEDKSLDERGFNSIFANRRRVGF